ncbi:MAG: VOC family protein [Phycisphaerales bacterium]|nr:MAG: VOC family protein [Phycisphaerales bacterium]
MSEATKSPPAAGTFCWNELMTRDVAAAKEFYTSLLGWKTEDVDIGECGIYTVLKAGEEQIGGMFQMAGEQFEGVPANWMSYIAVDDVEASTKKAEALGAKIEMPPADIPDTGRFSVITDPTGATIALFSR